MGARVGDVPGALPEPRRPLLAPLSVGELDPPARLLAGRIGKPHGLNGEVYVMAISDDPSRFSPGSVLRRDSGEPLAVEASRPHHNRLLVKFRGVDDRSAAENLRGSLFVGPEDLRELDDHQWWEHELVGLLAVDAQGNSLGRVTDVVFGPAQDHIVLATAAGERLVPLVAPLIRAVEVAAGRIVLEPPEGLLD
jgi:16S rRNA processing protein RimM